MSTPVSQPNGRKTLKTLQLSTNGTLIGSENRPSKNPISKIKPSSKPIKVFADKKKEIFLPRETGVQTDRRVDHEQSSQTDITAVSSFERLSADPHNDSGVCSGDIDQEAYDLMVTEPIPESYWRDLAEERRLSLAEALSENEMLHQSMEELQDENQNLSLLAGQAEYLASILNTVVGDEDRVEATTDESSDDPAPTDSPVDTADTEDTDDTPPGTVSDAAETVNATDSNDTTEGSEEKS